MCTEIERRDLRLADGLTYTEVLTLQRSFFQKKVDAAKANNHLLTDLVLTVEHSPVYTLGRHADKSNFRVPREYLLSLRAEVAEIERGGDITFHGPGQLVVYPIIDLQRYKLGAKAYVSLLEEAVIRTLASYNIRGVVVESAPGVWIDAGTADERKICAIGVTLKRFISMHGLALNVNTDMRWFDNINPCGFKDKGVTSIAQELGHAVDFEEVADRLYSDLVKLLEERM